MVIENALLSALTEEDKTSFAHKFLTYMYLSMEVFHRFHG